MPSLADQTLEQYAGAGLDHTFGVQVTLTRAGKTTDPFTATYEDQKRELLDANGMLTAVLQRRFVLPAVSCVIDGQAIRPQRGDRITVVDEDATYDVLPKTDREAVELLPGEYRYSVDTKKVG